MIIDSDFSREPSAALIKQILLNYPGGMTWVDPEAGSGMSEMVERVAMAIYQSPIEGDPYAPKWADLREKDRDTYRDLARDAIGTMRQPTEEMELAFTAQGTKRMNFKLQFAAAIDAVLK